MRLRNIMFALLVVVIALMFCAVISYVLFGDEISRGLRTIVAQISLQSRQEELDTPIGNDSIPVSLEIISGDTPYIVAQKLLNLNMIADAELFVDFVRFEGIDTQLEAGVHFVNQTMSIRDIATALTDASLTSTQIRVLAGWRIEELAEAIDQHPDLTFSGQDFLNVVGLNAEVPMAFAQKYGIPSGASLEGFLLEGLYNLPKNTTPQLLRDYLLERFTMFADQNLLPETTQFGYSVYEIVTLASIVQREAVQADERPAIAGVYLNRLNRGMNLDADPTVQYGLGNSRGSWWAQITQADYQTVNSPYNTYLNGGLPPGPIAIPSTDAMLAVINYQPSDFLFFRADCRDDGYHDFALTYEEHLANGC